MKKSKCPKYVWYLAILHILFPLFFLIQSVVNPSFGITEGVAIVGGITAFFLILFYYSSVLVLRMYKKLNAKSAWFVFIFTVLFPWIFAYTYVFIGESNIVEVQIAILISWFIIWMLPYVFAIKKYFADRK
jgi:hypothetical protein